MRTPWPLTMILTSLLLVPPAAALQSVPGPQVAPHSMSGEKKMEESMMAHHKEMMARMEAMDARLDELVKKMNAATRSRKADAVAAVVNELVAQRKQMREHMMAMQPKMMKHRMEHMQTGMLKGMADSMSGCPMMKTMPGSQPDSKKPGKDAPSEH